MISNKVLSDSRPARKTQNLAKRTEARARADENTDITDIVADLNELLYLIDDLVGIDDKDSGQPNIYRSSYDELLEKSHDRNARMLKGRTVRLLDVVEQAARWADSRNIAILIENVRKEFLSIKGMLRRAYRQKGAIQCGQDWQSPAYEASLELGKNRLNEGIYEHSWDYKRDGHLEACQYENYFCQEHLDHLGSDRLKAYLANSGMAAFSTVLHWLSDENKLSGPCLAVEPMYFENIHLIRAFLPDVTIFNSPASNASGGQLLDVLRKEKPHLVLLDAITNCGEVVHHSFDTVVSWAALETDHPVFVVIDTTCLPAPILPQDFLKGLPDNVSVLLVESLAKHHQFGMDIVTGGIVLAHMEKSLHESFHKTRARLGTNIADGSVGSLPGPCRKSLLRRLLRHSRNMSMLAAGLEKHVENGDGILASISLATSTHESSTWFKSAVMSLRLADPFQNIDRYQEFEKKVLELAGREHLPVAFGTSFGFDVTRLYVTAPATKFEPPFLRLSIGTETKTEIKRLLNVIIQADCELKRAWQVDQDTTEISADSRTTPAVYRSGISRAADRGRCGSVYKGQDALKDYLNPGNTGPTPLVELPADLNPYRADGVRLFAKVMPLVPLMNIKSLPAFSMLSQAAERGDLEGVRNLIESSSSNTVLSLSIIGRAFGINNTLALVDHSISPSLLRMLQLFGVEPFMHPGPGHELYEKMEPRSQRARRSGQQDGWMNPGQYTNPDNPDGFSRWLGPDLWAQTEGRLRILSCGLGTCGTLVGISRALKEKDESINLVACSPRAGEAVPGPRQLAELSDVAFDWRDVADACLELPAKESFEHSVKLIRRGIFGGPSSGMNFAGMLKYISMLKEAGKLSSLADENGELWATVLCCDSPLQHIDQYFEVLGEDYFPQAHPIPSPAASSTSGGLQGDLSEAQASAEVEKTHV